MLLQVITKNITLSSIVVDMFSFFKKKKPKLLPLDFRQVVTDMHSHLIPGIDDGSTDLQTSINLIKTLKKLGFNKLITTPHIMSDFYKNTPEIILGGLQELNHELNRQSIEIELSAAAEYYIDYEFESKVDADEKFLTLNGKSILIETSFLSSPPNFGDSIFKLQLKGYNVILAHPERYLFMSIGDLQMYKERSVNFQLNLLSLLGYYGKEVQKRSEYLVDENVIDYVGTDCHNINQADLYDRCFTNKYWHKLLNSGKLKNHLL